MRHSEAIAIAYFIYLSVVAAAIRLPIPRRLMVWLAAGLGGAVEIIISVVARGPTIERYRDWAPMLVILLGYFMTGAFYVAPSARVEAWLQRWDDRLMDRAWFGRIPPGVRLYLEIVYDACFLMIPGGFAVLVLAGRSAAADGYWTLVVAAELLAFSTLPWMQARPPWAAEKPSPEERSAVRRFSLFWVSHVTIRANTFPSGHASGSLAVALALWPVVPWAGMVFTILAISIAAGSVVGRFHYAVDAIAGLLLALALWALALAGGI